MKLETLVCASMIGGVNSALGTQACIDFYTATGDIPTTGLMSTGRLALHSTPISTATTTNVGTFNTITSNTVITSGTVAYFAILNTNATATAGNVMLTGSVGTDTGDITFNTVVWDANDNVSITSLTFMLPQE